MTADDATDDPEWFVDAACAGTNDPDLFSRFVNDQRRARAKYCDGCPVVDECLEHGRWERHGVWGGTTETERRSMKRRSRIFTRVDP